MTTLISATPHLDEKESERFLAMVEEGLKHPVGPVPTPRVSKVMKVLAQKIAEQMEERDKEDIEFWAEQLANDVSKDVE